MGVLDVAVFSLWLLMYDTAGAAKLYNYFLRPLLANRDSQIETTAEKVYTSAVEMWYVFSEAVVEDSVGESDTRCNELCNLAVEGAVQSRRPLICASVNFYFRYRPTMALVAKAQTVFNNLME